MTTPSPIDQYLANPQGQDALRFMDETVVKEDAFRHQNWVENDDPNGDIEFTLLYDKPGDGYIIGLTSTHKYAGAGAEVIIRTDKAVYGLNDDVFFRLVPTDERPLTQPFEASVLGDGISGRIGEPKQLPGSEGPEIVTSIELRRGLVSVEPDILRSRKSPFASAKDQFEFGREYLERRKRGVGSTAINGE